MMDVQYLDRVAAHPIKDLVGIGTGRKDPRAFASGGTWTTFRPAADAGDDVPDASFHAERCGGVMQPQPFTDVAQIILRRRGEDNFHLPRNLAKAASTSSSVANRPCSASRRPRSMPASSSGEG